MANILEKNVARAVINMGYEGLSLIIIGNDIGDDVNSLNVFKNLKNEIPTKIVTMTKEKKITNKEMISALDRKINISNNKEEKNIGNLTFRKYLKSTDKEGKYAQIIILNSSTRAIPKAIEKTRFKKEIVANVFEAKRQDLKNLDFLYKEIEEMNLENTVLFSNGIKSSLNMFLNLNYKIEKISENYDFVKYVKPRNKEINIVKKHFSFIYSKKEYEEIYKNDLEEIYENFYYLSAKNKFSKILKKEIDVETKIRELFKYIICDLNETKVITKIKRVAFVDAINSYYKKTLLKDESPITKEAFQKVKERIK